MRNPRLFDATRRFEQARRELGLPGSVRVSPDAYFESRRVRFEFDAESPEELHEAAETLRRAALSPRAEALFGI